MKTNNIKIFNQLMDEMKNTINTVHMRKVTFEDVRLVLGLETFETFHHPAAPENRGTGKTTAMLLRALVDSQDNHVVIYGHTVRYSLDLTGTCRSYAMKVGLDPEKIIDPRKVRQRVNVWLDHYQPYTYTAEPFLRHAGGFINNIFY